MTNACAWFNVALRPQKPEGSLGRGAQDGHLDFHTAPELSDNVRWPVTSLKLCMTAVLLVGYVGYSLSCFVVG